MKKRPIIGITMGDPSGIGPEIVIKALADKALYDLCRPVVFGDEAVLSSNIMNAPCKMSLNPIQNPVEATGTHGTVDLVAVSRLNSSDVLPGKPTPEGGKAMVAYIVMAVQAAQEGATEAVVTCPINKSLMHGAGYRFEGHTQLLAHLTHTDRYVMMLAGKKLRVALVTIHCALKDVSDLLSTESIYQTIALTAQALQRDFGIDHPRLAVAALNPHGSESGLFGSEEEEIIKPAVTKASRAGWHSVGPLPADTLFYKAATGHFDAVVAMYHDQGLIPLKVLDFADAVNITLGLPIVRTSVDHGTAYDIAGSGKADASSLKAAVRLAVTMALNRRGARRKA